MNKHVPITVLPCLCNWSGPRMEHEPSCGRPDAPVPPVLRSVLGAILTQVRHGQNKTLAAELGVHPTSLSRFKNPTIPLTVARAQQIADTLGVTLADLWRPENVASLCRRIGSEVEPAPTFEDAVLRLLREVRAALPLIRDESSYGTTVGRLEALLDDVGVWYEEADQDADLRRATLDCHGQP